MNRVLTTLAISVLALLGVGLPANAQDDAYPPRFMVVTVSDHSPDPGQKFEVTLTGCDVDDRVDYQFEGAVRTVGCEHSESARSVVATDTTGTTTARFTAPARGGEFTGTVTLISGGRSFDSEFSIEVETVEVRPTAVVGPTSTDSGLSTLTIAGIGLLMLIGLLLAGGLWFASDQRRDG